MIGSTEKKFIYFQVWKTGTTSLTKIIAPYCNTNFGFGIHYMPRHLLQKGEAYKKAYDDFYTFAFVRSPWDWITSEYFWAKKAPAHFNHKFFNSISFDEFIEWRLKQTGPKSIQYTMLSEDGTLNTPVSLDFIGRFESLYDDIEFLKSKFGFKGKLGWEKNSNHKPYKEYFTKETWDKTAEYFKKDIEYFGYEKLIKF